MGEAPLMHPTSQSTDIVLGSNSSTQFQHYLPGYSQIPQAKGSVLLSPKTSDASRKSRLLPVLLTNWLEIRGSHNPSSGSVNLPEWLMQLREIFHVLDYWFITKDLTQEQPDGRDAQGKV